jgi:hypothetical protein
VGVDGNPFPEDCVLGEGRDGYGRTYREGGMTGIYLSAAVLFSVVVVILLLALRS